MPRKSVGYSNCGPLPKTRTLNMSLALKQKFPEEKMRVVKAMQIVLKQYPHESMEGIAARTFGIVDKWRKENHLISSLGRTILRPTRVYKFVKELKKLGIIREK